MKHSAKNKNVILIGMPGSGKSTIGFLLAKAMSRNFLDTDVFCLNKKTNGSWTKRLIAWPYKFQVFAKALKLLS